jgi:DUF177 domain-containing protein
MRILISEIPEEGLDLQLKETIESDIILSPVLGRLKIIKVGAEVIVRGELRCHVRLQCGRCLKDFSSEVSVPVDVVYRPVQELTEKDHRQIKGEELDADFYAGEEIDLLDLLKEQIVLSLPMKPLCDSLCKGICVKCGTDLNENTCGCKVEDMDPRLEALKKLLN